MQTLKRTQIDFKDGGHSMAVEAAQAIYKNLGIGVVVNDGVRLTFRYEGNDGRVSKNV